MNQPRLFTLQETQMLSSAPRPTRRALRAMSILTLVTGVLGAGCEETIEVGNEAAVVTAVGPVRGPELSTGQPGDARVFVEYALRDTEFDDVDVVVTVCACADGGDATAGACEREACGLAIQGIGGDGTSRVPTVPARADLDHAPHLFVWDAQAGRVGDEAIIDSQTQTSYVVGVAIDGTEEDPLFSAPFTLDALGVTLEAE